MWILKNSKDLLDNLKSRSFSHVSSITTFDFSTLFTTLPHDKLKTRLKESSDSLPEGMFKEVMHDLWLARISSLSNEVGLYVVLLEVLLFMPNSLIRHSKTPQDTMQRKVHSGIINLFDERIVYSPDKDSVCSKRGTTEIL
jgi:hypothetical protein